MADSIEKSEWVCILKPKAQNQTATKKAEIMFSKCSPPPFDHMEILLALNLVMRTTELQQKRKQTQDGLAEPRCAPHASATSGTSPLWEPARLPGTVPEFVGAGPRPMTDFQWSIAFKNASLSFRSLSPGATANAASRAGDSCPPNFKSQNSDLQLLAPRLARTTAGDWGWGSRREPRARTQGRKHLSAKKAPFFKEKKQKLLFHYFEAFSGIVRPMMRVF